MSHQYNPSGVVYDDLILHISPDKFFIESLTATQIVLVIDRINHDIGLETNTGQIPAIANRKPIAGLIGIINLLSGPYLVVVTRKARVGEVCGADIWRVVETEIISYARAEHHLTASQLAANRRYTAMLQQILSTPYFYFSYSWDISHTRQRLDELRSPEFLQKSLLARSDPRFVWNSHLLSSISANPQLHRYALPLIHGFVAVHNSCGIAGRKFAWSLISRRSKERAGTRLFVRGADRQGNVANFVETEQLVEVDGNVASFVQVRGSIPLIWTQRPDLRYKPPPTLDREQSQEEAFTNHFQTQVKMYGHQVIVNLVNQQGSEGRLESQLRDTVAAVRDNNVHYEPFDFHHECRKMRWDRLKVLIDRLTPYQEQYNYFLQSREGTVLLRQTGVFRTNCIDCLDRTNVVQSLLARRNLRDVLVKMEVIQEHVVIEQQESFERLFKNIWADHADLISIQYSGTGALKTDFTRTGNRTKMGLLEDGKRSVIRYYKNNFADGFRQDSMDLFVGNYVVHPEEGMTCESPLAPRQLETRYVALPLLLLLSLAMLTLSLILPAELSTEILLSALFWAVMILVMGGLMLHFGTEFVDHPKLVHLPPPSLNL